MKKVIDEASKALTDLMDTVKKSLMDSINLSKEEANYVTSLYLAIKDKDLFKSSYFKGIEFELDEGDKVPDLNNVQQVAKDPELLYDIVIYALHTPAFLEKYEISFDGEEVELIKQKKLKKEEKPISTYTTKFDEYKVGEDDNWITFLPPDHIVSKQLRTYYRSQFPDDKRISQYGDLCYPSWCVVSSDAGPDGSSRGYFYTQKKKDDDLWFITYNKKNPIEALADYLESDGYSERAEQLRNGNYFGSIDNARNAVLGEIFLRHSDPNNDNDYGDNYTNYGVHNFKNNPGTAIPASLLVPEKTYNYNSFKIISIQEFTISGNTLITYNKNEKFVKIPEGVTQVATDAFKNAKNLKEVVLPNSLYLIKTKAFYGAINLEFVRATNNLAYIEREAFDPESFSFLKLGVFKRVAVDEYIINKPSSLRYYSKNEFNRDLPKYEEASKQGSDKAVEESIVNEMAVRVKKPSYFQNDYISVEGESVYFNSDDRDFGAGEELIIPEGVKFVRSAIKGSFSKVVFPSTFEKVTTSSAFYRSRVDTLDFSKTSILSLQAAGVLLQVAHINKVILPQTVMEILPSTFLGSYIKEIYIPSSIEKISSSVFSKTPFLQTIYTDNVEVLAEKLGIDGNEFKGIKIERN